eukprot:1824637-Rhodomonas_salina.1
MACVIGTFSQLRKCRAEGLSSSGDVGRVDRLSRCCVWLRSDADQAQRVQVTTVFSDDKSARSLRHMEEHAVSFGWGWDGSADKAVCGAAG